MFSVSPVECVLDLDHGLVNGLLEAAPCTPNKWRVWITCCSIFLSLAISFVVLF
jgi:hypothetical protein